MAIHRPELGLKWALFNHTRNSNESHGMKVQQLGLLDINSMMLTAVQIILSAEKIKQIASPAQINNLNHEIKLFDPRNGGSRPMCRLVNMPNTKHRMVDFFLSP